MTTTVRRLAAALASGWTSLVAAQTFAALEDGAIAHTASGWIFE